MPHNIERSAFRKGEYVGWDAEGGLWNIKRHPGGYWYATERAGHGTLTGDTLRALSTKLAA
ncbi:hypothetical protein QUC32_23165 [Novosphingobium resinovorum]|uniref:hypothetical protein n=1 Tax=Novosphingobium TaxID=165696 RepID=UPI001B3C94F1|nr:MULTISPECIES: hypothetical protein [Novosphingobium]MBF7012552.1 hypothetical protein [Novosphingobium sp. HR1a]WJM27285.1 hypothetical protein QUC32_23165 [Novosphingobium resinovorum]